MLKSFYGCCPLRNGVGIIAIINFIGNACSIIYSSHIYISGVSNYNIDNDFETSDNDGVTINNDPVENSTENVHIWVNSSDFPDTEPFIGDNVYDVSKMNIFMDYAPLVVIGWIFLKIVVNVELKKSTFAHAPHKIYAWLIFYGANVTFMLITLTEYLLMANSWITDTPTGFILSTSIIALELLAVYSYYRQEMKTSTSHFVQLKWQYITKGRVLSKGTDYANASTFVAELSNQSRIRKTTPYVINIQQ